jgi:hypothetical protein
LHDTRDQLSGTVVPIDGRQNSTGGTYRQFPPAAQAGLGISIRLVGRVGTEPELTLNLIPMRTQWYSFWSPIPASPGRTPKSGAITSLRAARFSADDWRSTR